MYSLGKELSERTKIVESDKVNVLRVEKKARLQ